MKDFLSNPFTIGNQFEQSRRSKTDCCPSNCRVFDAMEPMREGVHRALLSEESPVSSASLRRFEQPKDLLQDATHCVAQGTHDGHRTAHETFGRVEGLPKKDFIN